MGWTSMRAVRTKDSIEMLKDEFPSLTWHNAATIGGTVYAAVSLKSEPEKVFGLVVLVERTKGNFSYKEMDEDMGPCESRCPDDIIDLLTPTTNQLARAWRARCRVQYKEFKERLQAEFRKFEEQARIAEAR